jgi:hypothetical protein
MPKIINVGYRVVQAMTRKGITQAVNNCIQAGFLPLGGISVEHIGTINQEPLIYYTQAMIYQRGKEEKK